MTLHRQIIPSVLYRTKYEIPRASMASGVSVSSLFQTATLADKLWTRAIGSEFELTAIEHSMTMRSFPRGVRKAMEVA